MSKITTHIYQSIRVWLFVFISIFANAQMIVEVGDTSTLAIQEFTSVNSQWEIYTQNTTIDFAKTKGLVTSDAFVFQGGNIGETVNVTWLKSGVYFYKAIANNGCSDNFKIGQVIVKERPNKPSVDIFYDCALKQVKLTAKNYTGTLLWSSGETTSEIISDTGGTYTLVQIVNGVLSDPVEVFIANPSVSAPDLTSIPTTFYLDEEVNLSVGGCESGTIKWFTNKELTNEVNDLEFNITEDGTYYAVCVTDQGCESESSELKLIVTYKQKDCSELFEDLKSKISNFISPNNDGINDFWLLEELLKYCQKCNKIANVEIFNRWGNTVFQSQNYFSLPDNQKFGGTAYRSRAAYKIEDKLPTSTYFYIIRTQGNKHIQGWIHVRE